MYSCGGKIGKYLGIYKNIMENLNLCQIRAYSYEANAYTNYERLTSQINECATTSPFNMTKEALSSSICKMPVSGSPAYYNIVFDTERYIHAVTLVGNVY